MGIGNARHVRKLAAIAEGREATHACAHLSLTGDRRNRRHVVWFQGVEVRLPNAAFSLLCDFIATRASTTSGMLKSDPVHVFRLRQIFGKALSIAARETEIIETASDGEYRLAFSFAMVVVDPSFRELRAPKFLALESRATILRCCCELKSV